MILHYQIYSVHMKKRIRESFCIPLIFAHHLSDMDVLVLRLYYASKGVLGPLIYTCMHAGHNAGVLTHEQQIPVNAILAELGTTLTVACLLLLQSQGWTQLVVSSKKGSIQHSQNPSIMSRTNLRC